ncbi:hypothetical protein N431DRAFT_541763 [Stipitochalara longipes BDJ]|nr:hypothetical protein N431DRAFT_541763 [Stipitochalara longipes BDJ]
MAKTNNTDDGRSSDASKQATAGSRRRGRPQKESENPAIEQQRARVRRAQKAYRTRKEKHVTALEEKCHELEGVVEDMTNTFIAFSDNLLNSANIGPEITKELRGTMKKFLVLSEKAARDPWEPAASSDENNEPLASDPITDNSDSSSKSINNEVQSQWLSTTPPFFEADPILRDTGNVQQTPVIYGTNIMDLPNLSPYTNYGIWGLRPQHDRTSIIPYVIAGRDSFASRLFYSSIVRALRSLRSEGPAEDAYNIFRFKFRYMNPKQIQAKLDRVLDTLLHGTSQKMGDNRERVRSEEEMLVVKAQILREIEMAGGSEEEYLSTWDVERYLRNKWRLSLDSNWVTLQPRTLLANPVDIDSTLKSGIYDKYELFAPTVVPGFSQPKQVVWDASSLVEKLEGLTVSIGEGPRWNYKDVDAAVEEFLEENRGS